MPPRAGEHASTRPAGGRTGASRLALLLALLPGVAGLSGCYTLHAAKGQLRILTNREPIEEFLAKPDVDPDLRRKLELVLEVRRFAADVIQLDVGDTYTKVYDTQGEPVAWNVSASAPDALSPVTWSFPIVGTVPYLGYFDKEPAQEAIQELKRDGQDALLLPVPAYSTLGWFEDPIFTSMLKGSDAELVETIIHELAHATVWIPGDAEFNETLATFVGRQGAHDYFLARGGPDDPALREAQEDARASRIFNEAAADLRAKLMRVYEATGPRAEKLRLKQIAFKRFRERFAAEVLPQIPGAGYDWVLLPQIELNNALLLTFRRYHGELDLFRALYERCGRDLVATVQALKALEEAEDPRAALQALVVAPNEE